jgi:hypothetical protein
MSITYFFILNFLDWTYSFAYLFHQIAIFRLKKPIFMLRFIRNFHAFLLEVTVLIFHRLILYDFDFRNHNSWCFKKFFCRSVLKIVY